MKFTLYRFPDVIRYGERGGGPYVEAEKGIRKKRKIVPCELVGVVYGESIYDVTDELVKIIQDEMNLTYGGTSDVFGPTADCDVLEVMSKEDFRYQMSAVTRGYDFEASKEIHLYFGIKELAE